MIKFTKKIIASLVFVSLLAPAFQPVLAVSDTATAPAQSTITEPTSTTATTSTPVVDTTTTVSTAPVVDTTQTSPTKTTAKPSTDKGQKSGSTTTTLSATSASTSSTSSGGSGASSNNSVLDKLKLKADTATGALNFSYPLVVPSGRNGLQPDLNLSYNSQLADNANFFGYGWSLNIPSIERLNKKGIDKMYAQNDFVSSLSGELKTVSLTDTTHGLYGAKVDSGEWLKYEFKTDNSWVVTAKNGLKYTFGLTTASRQDDPVNVSRIYKWLLAEVRDTNDNFIKYEYLKDDGQIYPCKIKYTGSGVVDGIYEVEFVRDSVVRNDKSISYNTGFKITTNYKTSEVQVKTNSVWTKKYVLNYLVGDNGVRSVLKSITESGKDEAGNIITLPASSFGYQKKSGNWIENTTVLPEPFIDAYPGIGFSDTGVRMLDVNGDGLVDVIKFRDREEKKVYINNGQSWQLTSGWTIPGLHFTDIDGRDQGIRFADVNGDGLVDILNGKGWLTKVIYLNKGDGTGWLEEPSFVLPELFVDGFLKDTGVRLLDINGDNLVDIIKSKQGEEKKIYINNGKSWQLTSGWFIPGLDFTDIDSRDLGVRFADVNGDGLVDILNGQGWWTKKIYLNKGDGTGWVEDVNFILPELFVDAYLKDTGSRLVDINGDGLIDIIKSITTEDNKVYLNNGQNWQLTLGWTIPSLYFTDIDGRDLGVRLDDINGDNLIDILQGYRWQKNIYVNNNKISDNLISIIYPNQGSSIINYKPSAQYRDATNKLLNPKLPFVLQTINQLVTNDGQNNLSTTTYQYQDGQYYFNSASPSDRKFAGFGQVVKTDSAGNVSKTFYHQGNISNSTQGEYLDNEAKIGKVYREELYDNLSKLYQKNINKWESVDLGNQRNLVKLSQAVDFSYDGLTAHKDKAVESQFDNTTGNQTKMISYGEVSGNDDGTLADIGTDKLITDLTYASNTAKYIIGLPAVETTTDQNLVKIKETKYYYDNLALNSVSFGNATKQENWLENSTYLSSQKAYNAYGNVVSETDPKTQTTTYGYDSYNLYPTTITNPLLQTTAFVYNYNIGKVSQTTDPNNAIAKITFDGLGRVVKEEQSDIATPTTLVIKTAYVYNDTVFPNSIKKTDYLDVTNSIDSYTYLDGFSRPIQTKTESETANTFSTKDFIYNSVGLLQKESLPYYSTGISFVPPLAGGAGGVVLHPNLFISYTYDPLQRIITSTNSLGTTANTYTNWKVSTIDQNNNKKTLTKDAYDNLVKVEEYYSPTSQNSANSTTIYTTNYQYNSLNKLVKIRDAENNVRNFIYDNLGRLKNSEDLHAPADTTFGTMNYTYDNNSNTTSQTDAKNQTTSYTYDKLNRKLTEDYAGQAGVGVSNVYDSCLNGVGRLCSTTSASTTTSYQYNILGLAKNETKQIGSASNLPAVTNLIGHWNFNEGTGIIASDQSNNNLTGTLVSTAPSIWVTGKSGGGLNFDGNDDYVSINHNTALLPQAITISTWINPRSSTDYSGIVTKRDADGNLAYGLMLLSNNRVRWVIKDSSGNEQIVDSDVNTINLNQWNHLVATWDGLIMKLYINGNQITTTHPCTSMSGSTALLIIGRHFITSNSFPFNGLIDEVRLYKTALTISEITDLYSNPAGNSTSLANTNYTTAYNYDRQGNQTKITYPDNSEVAYSYNTAGQMEASTQKNNVTSFPADTNLKGYWNFDENSGAVAYDQSGNSNNGTITGATFTAGKVNTAVNFDNISGKVVVSNNLAIQNIFDGGGATSVWFKAVGIGENDNGAIADKSGPYGIDGWNLRLYDPSGTTARIRFEGIFSGTDGVWITTNRVINFNTTNHLVVNYSADSISNVPIIYLNGINVPLTTITTPTGTRVTDANKNLYIGNHESDSRTFNGWIDELKIYDRSLTLSEIQALYTNPAGNNITTIIQQTDYNPLGQITYQKSGNGIQTAYTYDENKLYRLTNKTTTGNTTYQNLTYTYDNVGNITQIVDASSVSGTHNSTYQYDSLYRLTQTQTTSPVSGANHNFTQTYQYSPIGNILNKSDQGAYQYQQTGNANPSAVTNVGTKTFTYDNNGNMTNDGTWTHSYDYNNRLTQSTTATKTITYVYDANGERVSKSDGTKTTYYPSKYYEVENGVVSKHIYAGNDKVATINNGQTYYHHTDHLGGSNLETDSSGVGVELVDYYPFGQVRIDSKANGLNYQNNYKFTGKELDTDTGLYYYGARYYNSEIGRFTREDPLSNDIGINKDLFKKKYSRNINDVLLNPQSLNSYSYVSNNPLSKIDPSGEAEIYIRNTGPINAHSFDLYSQGGHTLIKVNNTYYGFAPLNDSKKSNDVQVYHGNKEFETEYKGQTWQKVNIGIKYDEKIVSQFENLQKNGDKKDGIYRTLTNNCTEKAYDVLTNAGVWNDHVKMPYTVLPNQMSKQFEIYKKAENVYGLINKKYEPLVKSISTIKNK
jgi:RHS repeat-associated protein